MTLFLEQVFAGIATGLLYGSIALALAVVFKGSGVVNIAQGELALVSIYMTWQWMEWGIPFIFAFVLTLAFSFVMGSIVELVFIRPVANAPTLNNLMVTIALLLGVNAIVTLVWGFQVKSFDSPFGNGIVRIAGAPITWEQIGLAIMTLLTVLLCGAFLQLTPAGLKMRAAATNPESSRYLGVNVGRMLAMGWGLAAVVGAVAGVMSAPITGVSPSAMAGTLLFAFAAWILGGTGSLMGAVVSGVILGVSTNLAVTYDLIGSDLSTVVPFAVILVVLLLRPQGLFGRVSAVRP